jgi:hypothetical protein
MAMQGIDVEAAVGRKITSLETGADDEKSKDKEMGIENVEPATPKREAEEEIGGEEKRIKGDVTSTDEDVELVDADGKSEDEKKVGEEGETKGADAVDTTTV